jgi:hypothetical protein
MYLYSLQIKGDSNNNNKSIKPYHSNSWGLAQSGNISLLRPILGKSEMR